MPTLNSSDVTTEVLHMLLYGDSGVGKTTFGCSAHSVRLLDLDGGVAAVRHLGIQYVPKVDLTQWRTILKSIEDALNDSEVLTVIIDSFTVLSMRCLNFVLKNNSQSTPRIQDYGEQIRLLQGLVDRLTSQSQTSVVLICHEEPVKDEASGTITYRPLVVGKFSSRISLFFDEVYRGVVKTKGLGKSAQEEYTLLTRKGRNYLAKSRLNLPAELPNDPKTWALIYGPTKGGAASTKL